MTGEQQKDAYEPRDTYKHSTTEAAALHGQIEASLKEPRGVKAIDDEDDQYRGRTSRWWRRDDKHEDGCIRDKPGAERQSSDMRYLMFGALPKEARAATHRSSFYDSALLASEFFQATDRCPSPSAVSERAILGLEHCQPRAEVKRQAQCQPSANVRRAINTDGATDDLDDDEASKTNSWPFRIASSLPTELLHTIYWQLGAADFNAARHTCQNWYIASLDSDLLVEQLKRGGWWSATLKHFGCTISRDAVQPLSGYLARECALAGHWTGQGLGAKGAAYRNLMEECAHVDVRDLVGQGEDVVSTTVHTASRCGKYFLLSVGNRIYAYALDGHDIRLLSRTSCETRVTALAIDASAGHLTFAALLEGRIGLYIDLGGTPSSWPDESQ